TTQTATARTITRVCLGCTSFQSSWTCCEPTNPNLTHRREGANSLSQSPIRPRMDHRRAMTPRLPLPVQTIRPETIDRVRHKTLHMYKVSLRHKQPSHVTG